MVFISGYPITFGILFHIITTLINTFFSFLNYTCPKFILTTHKTKNIFILAIFILIWILSKNILAKFIYISLIFVWIAIIFISNMMWLKILSCKSYFKLLSFVLFIQIFHICYLFQLSYFQILFLSHNFDNFLYFFF